MRLQSTGNGNNDDDLEEESEAEWREGVVVEEKMDSLEGT